MASTYSSELWKDIQKQARQLENEIDSKLNSLSKIKSSFNSSGTSYDTVPLLSEEHVFENMTSEIEILIAQLALNNDKMRQIQTPDTNMMHAIQRHKEILKDYELELNKIKLDYTDKRTHDMHSMKFKDNRHKKSGGLNFRDYHPSEAQYLTNSSRMIDDQISIAIETREHLHSQRNTFKNIQTRFNNISHKLPAVNSLLQRITFARRKESFILGFIMSFCLFLMLLYAFW